MTGFPDDEQIELTAEAAFGADLTASPTTWAWTDFGTDTAVDLPRLLSQTITIQRGCTVGAPTSQQTTASVQLLNCDGWLTPKLATSPWWPNVDAGTPIRLRLRSRTSPYLTDLFARTVSNGWGTTSTGGYTWTPGTASQYNVTGGSGTITFTAKADATKAINLDFPIRDVDFTFDASINAVATGVANVLGPTLRGAVGDTHVWAHMEFGLGGTVDCHIRETLAGVTTSLAQTTQPGLVYTAGTVIRCRTQLVGRRVRMRAWLASGVEPDAWTVDAQVSITATNTLTGMRSCVFAGNTNTLPVVFTVDNISISQPPYDRVEGYITDVVPTFTPQPDGTVWSTVQIDIGGIGSRSERADAAPLGPLRRSVEKSLPPPFVYWPCEDAEGSTIAVSAFPGHDPMQVTGPAVFAFTSGVPDTLYQSRFGTKPMISLAAGAKLTGTAPLASVQTEWAVSCIADFYVPGILPVTTELRVLEWQTAGTHSRWALVGTTTGYTVRAYNDALGTATDVITDVYGPFVGQLTFTVEAVQNGANIDVELFYNDNSAATGTVAGTLAQPGRIVANPDRANVTASVSPYGLKLIVGHIRAVDDTAVRDLPAYFDFDQNRVVYAGDAWFHEASHQRDARLCEEERAPFTLIGNPADTGITVLGAQQDGTFGTLLEAATDAGSGSLLYEAGFGYALLDRTARYNAPVALTVDMATYNYSGDTDPGAVLVPQLDARLPNAITVQRTDGAAGSYAADETYRKRRSSIAQGYTLDVLTDDDPRQHAGWRVHVNVDAQDALYPSVQVDLAANPGLIDAWLGCDIGSRVQRTNQPTIAGLGTIDQVALAITETIGPDTWLAVLNCAPAAVWDVGVWDDPGSLWQPTSTALGADATVSAVSLTVDGHGEPWTTGAVSLLIQIGAEHLGVTNITGTGPYTFTVVRAVNGVPQSHTTGDLISFVNPTVWAL